MTVSIIDTSVLIHLYRNSSPALEWIAKQPKVAIVSVSWLEFMQGAPSKIGQQRCLSIMQKFAIEHLIPDDQEWAMNRLSEYRLSHGAKWADCLIASVPHRLNVPLFTHNIKDFIPLLGAERVSRPY